MKKLLALALTFTLALSLISCSAGAPGGDQGDENITLNVYNWGEYIDQSILDEFEDETGIKINYKTFSTNEELYAKIKSGGASYDVIIPSDYMIGRMIEEDMLEKLDLSNIPNLALLDERFCKTAYDSNGEYTVPYLWGTLGIIYNTKYVKEEPTSWQSLWDERYKGKILMFDNSRDSIGIALKALGHSYNTTDETVLRQAAELLKRQKPLLQAYVMDQIFEKMIGEEAFIGPYYAGDFLTMYEENENLAFVIPSEGSNTFIDAMCIPKGAENKEAAEMFINFMCRTDIAVRNAEEVGYSTPSLEAFDELDEETRSNEIAYPTDETLEKCETFVNLPLEVRSLYDELWIEITAK